METISNRPTQENSQHKGYEKILNEIENNRFKSLDDPGIYGIKYRLSRLDFLKAEGACCSGHPDRLNDFDDGYLVLEYKKGENSRKFHDQITNVNSESEDYKISINNDEESIDRLEKGLPIRYGVVIEKKERNREIDYQLEPFELAKALKILWKNVSKVINGYEETPIPEQFEDWYFAFKSDHGIIKNTHASFLEFKDEITKRGGNFESEDYE